MGHYVDLEPFDREWDGSEDDSEFDDMLECPVCGSDWVRTRTREATVWAGSASVLVAQHYIAVDNLCFGCGEEGDFEEVNDPTIELSLARARKRCDEDPY